MKKFFRIFFSILLGVFIGSAVNMMLVFLGGNIIPLAEGVDPMNAMDWEFKYFIFPFLAHSVGTLTGAFTAARVSKNKHIAIPLTISLFFLYGMVQMIPILPAPASFVYFDLVVAYIPMGLLGWKISNHLKCSKSFRFQWSIDPSYSPPDLSETIETSVVSSLNDGMFVKVMRDTVIACVVGGFVGYRYFKVDDESFTFLGALVGIMVGYSLLEAFNSNKNNKTKSSKNNTD